MTFNVRSSIAVIAVAVGFSGWVRPATAATVFDSGGFEAPRYITGELSGQDTQGPWLKDAGTGIAVVQTAVKQSGAQAVQFTRPAAATGDTRYGVLKPLTPTGSLQILRVNWDMNVTQANVANVPFGPFLGVEGYDAFNDDPKLIGSLGVDATTGDILYQDEDGFFAETGVLAPFGQWNHYTLEMNYTNHQYTVYFNGAPLATSQFVDNELGITAFTDAPLAALAATFESISTATGTAYFDNYGIEIVPEPSTMAIIGFASLGLLRRRRSVA
jgi:hypothetical protein